MKGLRRLIILPALLLAVGFVAACGSAGGGQEGGGGEDGTMRVSATTSVIQDLAAQVGGDRVEVETIVPIGGSPETFQPSPGDAGRISEAEVVFENGLGLDDWIEDLVESAGNEDQIVVEVSEGLEPIEGGAHGDEHGDEHGAEEEGDEHGDEEHGDEEHADEEHSDEHGDEEHAEESGDEEHAEEEGDEHSDDEHSDEEHAEEEAAGGEAGGDAHEHAGGDPHFWLDVENAEHYVEVIRDTLVEAVPDGTDEYEANAEEYLATLEELDGYMAEQAESIPEENRKLVTTHEAFAYFAEAYGFELEGSIISNPEAEPSSREVAEVVTRIEDENIPAIFTEPQFSGGLADTISQEADVEVLELYSDTLVEDDSGNTYEAMMRTNIDRLVEGLG
ncbi:MAG: metal ABC transporter substrate-binding protein [Actinomycetota bacterium]|nr:metal ABC transporter substrate-binding protein [Actinomycetota bacterium]